MKVDSLSIDKQAQAQLLEAEYGLKLTTLNFVPGGEESYGYVAETVSQKQYFIKVYEEGYPADLNEKYNAAYILHTQEGLDYVVYPYPTKQGKFLIEFAKRAVAVYNFVKGIASNSFSDEDWAQVATLTASLHMSAGCSLLPQLPIEQFTIWFKEWLLRVLEATEEARPSTNEYQSQAKKLLTQEKGDILATLEKVEQLAEQAQILSYESSLTHGDLKLENWIKDGQGKLYLIDWSKKGFEPAERDLINFTGERFELFLLQYLQAYKSPPKLHPELFEYYSYFLGLWSIADYGSWILLEEASLAEVNHAWQELNNYLPINHQGIQAEVNKVSQILKVG